MTIDEAIAHVLEVVERQEKLKESKYISDIEEQYCDKCAADHRQLAEWLQELKEAKRLLRLAVDDLNNIGSCKTCVKFEGICRGCRTDYKWVHADEALKLIGDDEGER
jgi:hypothetical protein